jgi:GNAT superfamily N-acetyltransferase
LVDSVESKKQEKHDDKMTTQIIIGDLTNKQHTNAVLKLSLTHNFYIDAIWTMVLRKLSPSLTKQLRLAGWSQERIDQEETKQLSKYDAYIWELRLLVKDEKVIGFAFWDYPKTGKGCSLEFLLVDKAERGKKYGKLLMDDFIAWADANRPEIKIQFPIADKLLVKIYTKYGFKFEKEYAEPQDARDFMQLGLANWYRINPSKITTKKN